MDWEHGHHRSMVGHSWDMISGLALALGFI